MWRGRATSFSTNSAPSPNAASASLRQRANASAISVGLVDGAHAAAAAAGRGLEHHRIADRGGQRLGRLGAEASAPALPGTTGMPSDWASARARTLSPNRASVAGEGPMKRQALGLAALRRSAAFSARKP